MKTVEILQIVEIVIAVSICLIILLQKGGGGLGTMFGGSAGESYRSQRGAASFLLKATIFLVIVFVVNTLAIAILAQN